MLVTERFIENAKVYRESLQIRLRRANSNKINRQFCSEEPRRKVHFLDKKKKDLA